MNSTPAKSKYEKIQGREEWIRPATVKDEFFVQQSNTEFGFEIVVYEHDVYISLKMEWDNPSDLSDRNLDTVAICGIPKVTARRLGKALLKYAGRKKAKR